MHTLLHQVLQTKSDKSKMAKYPITSINYIACQVTKYQNSKFKALVRTAKSSQDRRTRKLQILLTVHHFFRAVNEHQ